MCMQGLLCVFVFGASCACAQTVEGSVIDISTRNGIAGVKVEIVRVRSGLSEMDQRIAAIESEPAYAATTDAQGRFRMDSVADGIYTPRFTAPEYLDENWAPSSSPKPPARFQVTAGGAPVQLEGRMIHWGMLSGRVVDGRGKPVFNARLDLTTGNLVGSNGTDANGRFQLALMPGSNYTLSVGVPANLKPPDPDPETGRVLGWARTYYHGVATLEAASKILLPPGGVLSDVEIKLLALPAHAIRGVLLKPDGKPAAKVEIAVGEDRATQTFRVESKDDGTFEFPAVVDGAWRLFAELDSGGARLRMVQWLEMSGHDREGLKLRLNAPFALRGRMVLETPQGQTAPRVGPFRLYPVGPDRRTISEPPLVMHSDADGNVSVETAYAGAYRFGERDVPPPGYYLDAVRLGDAELRAPDVEIASGAAAVTIVFKTNGGTVRGAVEKCSGGGVVLIPQDPVLRWPAAVRTGRCDALDRYQITAVRPGEYYAQAYYADTSMPIWEPGFDERLVGQASRVTVRAGETSALDLKAH